MYLRRALGSGALVLAAASACTSPGVVGDAAVLTEAEARSAMLMADELPGVWEPTGVPVHRGESISDSTRSGSVCARATRRVAKEASRWSTAEVDVEAAWETPGGDVHLKQEIVSDRYLEAGDLVEFLELQVSECKNVVIAAGDITVESRLRSCDLNGGKSGTQIVQSWIASNGSSGSTRLAYLDRGHSLIVLTFTSVDDGDSCRDAVFDRVIAAAAAKIAR